MDYLERGELSYAVRQELDRNPHLLDGSWLSNPPERDTAMSEMDFDRRAALMGMLRKADEIVSPEISLPAISRLPQPVLREILAWWRAERESILSCHDRKVYPDGHAPRLVFSPAQSQLESSVEIRKPWLILFMLGAMHRIGRVGQHQNRGFLDLCETKGWMDILAARADDPASWFGILDSVSAMCRMQAIDPIIRYSFENQR